MTARRKTLVNSRRLRRTLEIAIAVGLKPTTISHSIDGSVTISFGEAHVQKAKEHQPRGWKIHR